MAHRPRHHILALISGAALLVATGAPAASAAAPRPRSYYLALGDSIAYGFQNAKALAGLPPTAFDTGFADVFAARLRTQRPGLVLVNLSCPGESTTSMRSPCGWKAAGHALHDDYDGAQLDAALAFLRQHRGHVDPVTLSLNGNDIDAFVQSCPAGDLACIQRGAPAAIAAYQQRLRAIVAQLRKAAPEAELILTGSYDPDVGSFATADPLFQSVNAAEADVARAAHARFADPFPVFNPQGDPAAETAAVCALTLVCTDGDSHPSDAGYRALADVVWAAAGCDRRR
jgi:lysophospholipase L1-like esterase